VVEKMRMGARARGDREENEGRYEVEGERRKALTLVF
jgi:hypothetical protein